MARFFVEKIDPEKSLTIGGSEGLHMKRVLRLKVGDKIVLFDGKGGEFEAEIEEMREEGVVAGELRPVNPQKESSLDITLAQGIPKGKKMDLIIQKATELGVYRIIPVATERSVPQLTSQKGAERVERWRRIALEAAKQCGRSRLPEIGPTVTLREFLAQNDLPKRRLLLWEGEREEGIKAYLKGAGKGEIISLVGPEGGFSDKEVKLAVEAGFTPVSLGERRLRTETASLSLLTILQYEWGDLGGHGGS